MPTYLAHLHTILALASLVLLVWCFVPERRSDEAEPLPSEDLEASAAHHRVEWPGEWR